MRGGRPADIATYLALMLVAAFFVGPLLWLVSLALRTSAEVYRGAAAFIPDHPTLANFRQILNDPAFAIYLWNGVKLSVLGAALAVICAAPAAYAFSRLSFRGRGAGLWLILAVQMISPLVILIPLYRYYDWLGLLENHMAVVAVYGAIGIPLTVWLLRAGFHRIPVEIEEAARLDGYSRLETMVLVTLPLAAPSLAAAFVLNVVMNWGQFLVPFILLSSDPKWPISVAIYRFAGSTNASTTQLLAAACLVALVPAIVVFLALQRLLTRALTGGALKG
ncbi:carbohydrate ABC transporter permease [Qingshengfaniella alkalisoli]|uniref:Carbohydrate ABC transporter permease n=1 Tax=Qingshengfaniella alkalisoli TaxID=2599296 RepID=A0A5B8J2W6_9RHOB|nr:carbohydrate ABC transporter permease [Qingshengfaniella alkalisoli]QDY71098.1 carbohydrate ABC transporter permease [Qingshengfaniella alkalisoli]